MNERILKVPYGYLAQIISDDGRILAEKQWKLLSEAQDFLDAVIERELDYVN